MAGNDKKRNKKCARLRKKKRKRRERNGKDEWG